LSRETSWGFDFNDFCSDVIEEPNDPWQEWLSIHVGELLEDGRPRFRTVLVLVARQQGKTSWAKKLVLYWMFVDRAETILGTSTDRSYAKKTWEDVIEEAKRNQYLSTELGPQPVVKATGDEVFTNIHGSKYYFAANNRRAGRSLTLRRALVDELREHRNFDTWSAVTNAMNAVREAQIVSITNQGDTESVVLDSLRTPALQYIETGEGDYRLGLFEWSMPPGSDVTDLHALAMANPDLGNRTDPDVLRLAALRAKMAGGQELASFKTEVGCMRVHLLDPGVDPDKWEASGTDNPVDLANHRKRVALCFDVSLDGSHASLVAAAVLNGKVHTEVVKAWNGYGCTKQVRAELPGIVAKVKPAVLGWFPNGPAASVAADLSGKVRRDWPPRGVKIQEIKADTPAVCMGLAEQVFTGDLLHPRDPMQTAHIHAAQKLIRGDSWVFTRNEAGPIDGAYATAGAVHLARIMPPPLSAVTVL
jgi:phage terminase large subunit-like protein